MAAALEAGFAAAMAAFAPFEPSPHVAMGLSGGADSTALALLLNDWVAARGGRLTALTVDHGLRATSQAEAAQVARWAATAGINHVTLTWSGPKPRRAIQERARAARYRLLETWCAEAGVLHLCLGHQADDQFETVAMRAARRSREEGLAGMAALVEHRDVRLLRPLLGVRRAAIVAWLARRAAAWIDDPSNRDPRFLRSRLRESGSPGGGPAATAAAARAAIDAAVSACAAASCTFEPEGTASVELAGLAAWPPAVVRRLLQRVLVTCGGGHHTPREAALDGFVAWLAAPGAQRSRTLGGCVCKITGDRLIVAREPSAIPGRSAVVSPREGAWDGRFEIRLAPWLREREGHLVPGQRGEGRGAETLPVFQCLDAKRQSLHVFSGRGSAALVSVPAIDVMWRPAYSVGRARFFGLPEAAQQSAASQPATSQSASSQLASSQLAPPQSASSQSTPSRSTTSSTPSSSALKTASRRQASENSEAP